MKVRLLIIFLLIAFQIVYSQTERHINASVVCLDFALQGIDVANLVSKNTTITNNFGNFSILAKAGDQLVFISKKYEYKTITLKQADFEKTNFVISLIKKPEELDEVVVKKIKFDKLVYNEYEQDALDKLSLENSQAKVRNPFTQDGSIPNGMDINRMSNDFIKIIKKIIKREDKKEIIVKKIDFKEYATKQLKADFYNKSLYLKPEEVGLFLEFCDADVVSKTFTTQTNALTIMEFLFVKNVEFKKFTSSN
jgi:hypothetical protein